VEPRQHLDDDIARCAGQRSHAAGQRHRVGEAPLRARSGEAGFDVTGDRIDVALGPVLPPVLGQLAERGAYPFSR
jgi:hypothetical protein